MKVRRQILRLSSHCFAFTFSNIRHFTPLRMTKCAAEYRWWRCPKVVFKSLVTSHSRLLIPRHFLFPTLGKLSSAIYGRAAPWANPKPFLFYINFRRCP